VEPVRLRALGERITSYPQGFQPASARRAPDRQPQKMLQGEQPLDWDCAEGPLAYAALVEDGSACASPGRTVGGEPFSIGTRAARSEHRCHVDSAQHIADSQPRVQVIDSVLSEEAVMGFEYGYATTERFAGAVEAQYGDFANGSQVIIDQFISSGRGKWERFWRAGVAAPHGYEGAGPEHSSARLEAVSCNCARKTTAGVRAVDAGADVPHAAGGRCASRSASAFFQSSMENPQESAEARAVGVLARGSQRWRLRTRDRRDRRCTASRCSGSCFCSGKVYFRSTAGAPQGGAARRGVVRIEQLYPFPSDEYQRCSNRYPNAREVVWCQEERRIRAPGTRSVIVCRNW